jgi:outer membrane protein
MKFIITLCLLGMSTAAWSQQRGDLFWRLGHGSVSTAGGGALSAPSPTGAQLDPGSASALVAGVTYFYGPNLSVDLSAAQPYKLKLNGAGAWAGTGALGEVKMMPITVMAQYRFMAPAHALRPYVGLGLTHALFSDETGSGALTALTQPGMGRATKIQVDSKWAPTAQFGASYELDKSLFIDLSYSLTTLSTRLGLSSGQTQNLKLDPATLTISVGYKF